VRAPDLYDGNTFDDLGDGVRYAKKGRTLAFLNRVA
jgi:hypothetical protein